MVLQTYAFDEIEVGVKDFLGGVVAYDLNEESDDALYDEGVAVP